MKHLAHQFGRLFLAFCFGGLAGWAHAQTFTSPAGFRILVVAGASSDAIMRNRGIADQIAFPTTGPFTLTVPADAFAHTNPNAVVTLKSTQSSGQPLPPWLSFNAVTGKFTGRVAPGERRSLSIMVVARDDGGRSASTTFLLTTGIGNR